MKKTFIFSVFALATLSAFVACNKEVDLVDDTVHKSETIENNKKSDTIVLTVNAVSPETKTVFGDNNGSGYPITWAASDEAIELVELLTPTIGDASYKGYASTAYTLSNENATAIFSAEVDALTTEGTYDYHALYPQSAYKSANASYKDLYAIIPEVQTPPSDASPAAAATLLYAGSTGHSAQPTSSLAMSFSHITAYGKMTIKNASDAFADPSEEIASVTISVPAGGIYYYWESGNIAAVAATAKDAVTIKTDNLSTSGDFVAWFACAPYSLDVGDKLTVSVTTSANTYTRVITMTKTMSFESGKVSKFSVDMSSATAANDLTGNYLIVSTDGTNPWYAMTYQVSSNVYLGANTGVPTSTSIDVTDASTNFSSFCSSPYVWTLAKVSGGYTLKNAYTNKYATVNSDSNYGQASDSPVTLTVADAGSGVFTVTSQNYSSRSLQFNYNSGNTRFAFYSSVQKSIYFIPVSSYTYALATPTITAAASGTTITVSWDAVANASGYTVTCTGQTTQNLGSGVTSTTFEGLSNDTYTVTVTAVGSGSYSDSFAASSVVVVSNVSGTDVEFVVGTDFSTLAAINAGVTKDDITLTCNTTAYYSPLRIYSENTVKFSAASSKKIVKVVITGSSDSYIKTWTASDSGTCTISGSTMTWMSSGLSEITFTMTATAQARVTKFTVTYTD